MSLRTEYLTHDELQHIEHANKILREHLELVQKTVNDSEAALNTYIPIMKGYIDAVQEIQVFYTKTVVNILNSTRELRVIVGNHQELSDYISAANKLNITLNDELVQKIIKLVK